ncbi:hypothetical protein CPT_Mano_050 [Achromobacter phage Mano]|uniref:Uncharacterized protein n=1 Tax=Achromobacter phage Mano TaxID=2767570 RepID=A0A7L8G6U3_9CAUD|nr:transcriptional repressor [Achromobacter phage Mano]QOE32782.1 hypothetical protein CPT_Mano_050 [Achromobacter phage Mano]
MNKRTKRLHQLMAKHQLNAEAVGQLLDRAPTTISMWRVGTPRTIPAHMLALLEMKLANDAARNAA